MIRVALETDEAVERDCLMHSSPTLTGLTPHAVVSAKAANKAAALAMDAGGPPCMLGLTWPVGQFEAEVKISSMSCSHITTETPAARALDRRRTPTSCQHDLAGASRDNATLSRVEGGSRPNRVADLVGPVQPLASGRTITSSLPGGRRFRLAP
jgi:hypothetical protein